MINNPFEKTSDLEELFKKESPKKEPEIVEPKVVEPKVIEAKKEEIPVNESEHARILREHGGIESNIPIKHQYWKIRP